MSIVRRPSSRGLPQPSGSPAAGGWSRGHGSRCVLARPRCWLVGVAALAALALTACSSGSGTPPRTGPWAGSVSPSATPTGPESTFLKAEFSTGRRTTDGFGVALAPGTELRGTVRFENSRRDPPRQFHLLALLDGVAVPALGAATSVSLRGPSGTAPLVVPATLLPRGGHRLTVVLVDAEGDDGALDRPPFAARPLTYDIVVGGDDDVTLATYESGSTRFVGDAGPLLPAVVDDPASTFLRTRHDARGTPLWAKIGTTDKPLTHYVGLIVDGHLREWVPGTPGLLRAESPALAAVVQRLDLGGLPAGVHHVVLFDIPDLDRPFHQRRDSHVGSRTFLVTTG